MGFVLGASDTLLVLVRPEPDLRRDLGVVVDAGKANEVEVIVGGSYNGGEFADTKPEFKGEVVNGDEQSADVDITDDIASTPRDGGNNLIDEKTQWKSS